VKGLHPEGSRETCTRSQKRGEQKGGTVGQDRGTPCAEKKNTDFGGYPAQAEGSEFPRDSVRNLTNKGRKERKENPHGTASTPFPGGLLYVGEKVDLGGRKGTRFQRGEDRESGLRKRCFEK